MPDEYRRVEPGQIFAVPAPEQQTEVRKQLAAGRAVEQEKKKEQQSLLPR